MVDKIFKWTIRHIIMPKNNEPSLWNALDKRNKSYTVQVLHYYHFRRNRLHSNWKREETLTWELIRALEILPKNYFLKELLLIIKNRAPFVLPVISNLIKQPQKIEIIPYPELGLSGNKKNSRSDIGLVLDNSCLWIEAKTAETREKDFQEQFEREQTAPNLCNYKQHGLIALVPQNQKADYPHIFWQDVTKCFENAKHSLKNDFNNSIIEGYFKIADELIDRINALGL